MGISNVRKIELEADQEIVEYLYRKSCEQVGKAKVDRDLTHLWDLRCRLGISGKLPFGVGAMQCVNLEELLWVAQEVCGLPAEDENGS